MVNPIVEVIPLGLNSTVHKSDQALRHLGDMEERYAEDSRNEPRKHAACLSHCFLSQATTEPPGKSGPPALSPNSVLSSINRIMM